MVRARLGPKKVKQLSEQLDVASIPELEYACRENRLAALPGFGKTTQDRVLASITQRRAASTHLRLDRADELAAVVMARLLARSEVERVAVTSAESQAGAQRAQGAAVPGSSRQSDVPELL